MQTYMQVIDMGLSLSVKQIWSNRHAAEALENKLNVTLCYWHFIYV
jgi:hypothetical protein